MEVLKQKLIQNKYPLILTVFFVFFLFLFWGRFGDPVVDCGREAYIPYAMADLGKILFKDIVCIYGPMPYYLNAFVVKLFGPSLNVMYCIGAVLAYVFLLLFFSLAKRFFNGLSALFVTLAILFSCVFSPHLFNYIFPYSYAILYALVFSLFSMLFIFKFIDTKKPALLCAATLFLSCSVLSKYDFLPCVLILPAVCLLYKKNITLKTLLQCAFCLVIPFLILAIILLLQGVTPSDLLYNFQMISNMAHSTSLDIFYRKHTGFYFIPEKMLLLIRPFALSFLVIGAIFSIGFFAEKIKNKPAKCVLFAFVVLVFARLFYPIFFLLPLFVLFSFLGFVFYLFLKKRIMSLSDDDNMKFLFIFLTVLISLKTLFDLNLGVYGTFYLPCILLSFYLICFIFFKSRSAQYFSGINLLNLVFSLIFLSFTFNYFVNVKNVPVKTPVGTIFSSKNFAVPLNSVIRFLQENIKDDEDFLMLPEGLFLNFALKNEYKYFNTSFVPLDFEAYGEESLTKAVLQNLPKYLIITNRDSEEYGYTYICNDYGKDFCAKINNFYDFKFMLNDENLAKPFIVYVFERKSDGR